MKRLLALAAVAFLALGVACSGDDDEETGGAAAATPAPASGSITVYSGRAEALVAPLIAQFERETGIDVQVRYAGSAALAATIQEEGNSTPADVFWSQDPGPLGALSSRFAQLPENILSKVDAGLKSAEGRWIGVSGRSRVLVYNPDRVQVSQLPNNLAALTDPAWRDRVGWAPTNASFQIMVSAMRAMGSDATASQWLTAMKDNGAKSYGNNNAVLQAVAAGEIDVGLINHYYLHAARRTTPAIKAENHYMKNTNDAGSLMMVSGVAILSNTDNKAAAELFVSYLVSNAAQQYFATETSEYPVVAGVIPPVGLQNFADLTGPRVDFARLDDLQGTLNLLRQAGIVQ